MYANIFWYLRLIFQKYTNILFYCIIPLKNNFFSFYWDENIAIHLKTKNNNLNNYKKFNKKLNQYVNNYKNNTKYILIIICLFL